ncbi:MAG: HAMP domain-containing protein [Pseudomonadales bacterium]|nr:HAMP domain-containing protein [Pseudomonadales bacterium]
MRLKQRFHCINLLVLVSLLVLAFLSAYQFNTVLEFYQIRQDVSDFKTEFIRLKQNQNDFIIHKDNQYQQQFDLGFQRLQTQADALLLFSTSVGLEDKEFKRLKLVLGIYQQSFHGFILQQNTLGLNTKSGLLATINAQSKQLSSVISATGRTSLQLAFFRLHENEIAFQASRNPAYMESFAKDYSALTALINNDSLIQQARINSLLSGYQDSFNKLAMAQIQLTSLMRHMNATVGKSGKFIQTIEGQVSEKVAAGIEFAIKILVVSIVVIACLIVVILIWLSGNISSKISFFQGQVQDFVTALHAGNADLTKRIDVTGFDEIEKLSNSFNDFTSVLSQQSDEMSRLAKQSLIVKQALDNASIPALILNPDGQVNYVNEALSAFVAANQSAFFIDAHKLVNGFGLNELCQLDEVFFAKLQGCDSHFSELQGQLGLNILWQVSPIVDENHVVIAHIIEWRDQTEQLKTQSEVQALIEHAQKGDFSQQIELADKTGFYLNVSEGLNAMAKGVNQSLTQVSSALTAISEGDLDQRIDTNFSGKLAELANASNTMTDKLKLAMEDIGHAVSAIKQGQFNHQISEDNKQGFYLSIAQALNEQAGLLNSSISDVRGVLSAISEGDLSVQVSGQYQGQIEQLADYTNTMARQLDTVVSEVVAQVESGVAGDFQQRINTDKFRGFYLHLSNNLNQLNQSVEEAMGELLSTVSAMAVGDLTQEIHRQYQGVFDSLKTDTNETIHNLVDVIKGIQGGSANVKLAADDISSGNLDLSRRTEQQAASLEQTAASMELITQTIAQNTERSRHASSLADNTRAIAEKGGAVVTNAIEAMQEISESSNKIADIISVIDEIAFQTNLLALNASVEAARAGEQGRGFAVVAGEVRNLAGRSATAAKEIKDLIIDSGQKVEEGKVLVNHSGESLTEIVKAATEVSELVAEIAKATQDQSQGISEVNRAVVKMDEMTQQNAALVEEVASTSEAMGQQARDLEQKVSYFKLQ